MKYWFLALAAAVMAGCAGEEKKTEKAVATVKVAVAESCGGGDTWEFPCRAKAGSEVNVAFKVAGTLKRVCVREGQRVGAGTLLAEIDDTDYRVQLAATEAEHAQIKADAERVMRLYEQGSATASNNDKARYGLEQITAKLNHHRNQLAYCKIYAPEAGIVQQCLFEGGETIGAGMPVVQIVGNGNTEVELTVPAAVRRVLTSADAASVKASGRFAALDDGVAELRLTSILPKANATGMYTVKMSVVGGEMPAPGMSGWVTMSASATAADACEDVMVPTTAVVHGEGGDYLFKVADGKAVRTGVKVIELTGDGKARVGASAALKAGDRVVASGAHHVGDGMEVKEL